MDTKTLPEIISTITIPEKIPCSDIPGDMAAISQGPADQARRLIPALSGLLEEALKNNPNSRAVITVAGGSGVGKSSISSVLAYLLNQAGIPSALMSGDNYPLRIPMENDAERLRLFRRGGMMGLRDAGLLTPDAVKSVRDLQSKGLDSDPARAKDYPWFETYLQKGSDALEKYLGTPLEQDFDEVNEILHAFKSGASHIYFKRMGREADSLWYEKLDMQKIRVLILEWTHSNSEYVKYSDIPIFLQSTPEETLQYRLSRGRDAGIDSPFMTLVLNIEQKKLDTSAKKAAIILTKSGQLIPPGTLA